MKCLYCDVCKKEISDPYPGRTVFHYREFDLCEPCRDDLELAVKQTVRNKKPFDFTWLEKMKVDLIESGMKANKIPMAKR